MWGQGGLLRGEAGYEVCGAARACPDQGMSNVVFPNQLRSFLGFQGKKRSFVQRMLLAATYSL